MKRIFIYLLLFISIPTFAQEEIWGYHSVAGSKGGGIVFKLDSENKEVETIQRFDMGNIVSDKPSNLTFLDNGNGLLYGSCGDNMIYSYEPTSKELVILQDSLAFGELVAIDSQNIYGTITSDTATEVLAYNIEQDTMMWLLSIPYEISPIINGSWVMYDGKFYTNNIQYGSLTYVVIIEIDIENRLARKVLNIPDAYAPMGGLVKHSNGKIYGIAKTGGYDSYACIYSFNPIDETSLIEVSFNDGISYEPVGMLMEAQNGLFYSFGEIPNSYLKVYLYQFNPNSNTIQSLTQIEWLTEEFSNLCLPNTMVHLSDNKIGGVLENCSSQGYGKLFTFDLLSHEFEIIFNFENSEFYEPIGQFTSYENKLLGVYQNSKEGDFGGIYNLDIEENTVSNEKRFGIRDYPEFGRNPNWLCQGENGNIYGMTRFGGELNKGIVFEIDKETHVFSKKTDIVSSEFDLINPGYQAFRFRSDAVVGVSKIQRFINETSIHKDNGDYCLFEYNYLFNSFKILKTIPDSLGTGMDIKMNLDSNLYFSSNDNFVEYIYDENQFYVQKMDQRYSSLTAYQHNLYLGYIGYENRLWLYDKVNNTSVQLLSVYDFVIDDKTSAFFQNDFYIFEDLLFGSIKIFEDDSSYSKSFTYNIQQDSIWAEPVFSGPINDNQYSTLIADEASARLYKSFVSPETEEIGGLELYNINDSEFHYLSLENSPYQLCYCPDDDGDLTWVNNFPFQQYVAVGLIKIQDKNTKFWTGKQDSLWYNGNNWYSTKVPDFNSSIIIPRNAPNYPVLDTHFMFKNIDLNKQAKLGIKPTGSLSGELLLNNGNIEMYGNNQNRASLILENDIKGIGDFSYHYQSNKAQQAYIGIPIKETSWFQLDSITAFGYEKGDEEYFLPIEDSSYLFQAMNPYIFDLDSGQVVHFKGESNWGDMSYVFNENRFYSLANPYPSSFNWSQLDLAHLSHRALYRFNMEEDQFETYIDGLGDAHPLIQPLDVFWVYAAQNEQMDFRNADRIHASEFQENQSIRDHILKLKVDSKNGSDHTYISFNSNSSANFEYDKDALKMMPHRSNRPQILSYGGEKELGINQLPDTTMMDLAVKCQLDGQFTISIDSNMGYDYLILEDLIWNKRINLLEESYTFDYFTSDGNYPFKLYFTDWVLQPVEEGDIEVYYYPESIVVRSRKMIKQADIIFYDLAGKAVITYTENDFFKFEKAISLPTGHYIVQVRTDDVVKNTKVLIRR